MIQIKKSSTYFSLFFLNCLKKNNFILFSDGTNVGNCPSDAHTELMLGYANSISWQIYVVITTALSHRADSRVVWKCVILMIIIHIYQPIFIDQDIPNENKAPK